MIIKLPIIEDNKIIYELFKLYRQDNIIYLMLNNKIKYNINNIKINYNINDKILINESDKLANKTIEDNKTTENKTTENNNDELNNKITENKTTENKTTENNNDELNNKITENNNDELNNNNDELNNKSDELNNNNDINKNKYINSNHLLKIILCNDYGINYLNLFTPLKLYIIDDKYVWNIHFIQTSFLSKYENANIDFINILNNYLIKNFNVEILKINNLKSCEKSIWKIINNEYNLLVNNQDKNNLDQFIIILWNTINILLNSSLYILYYCSNISVKKLKDYYKKHQISKKIIYIYNIIKLFKFSINLSNNYTFIEHLNNIKKISVELNNIKINQNYFLIINPNKFLLVTINNIINNIIICNNILEIDYNKYKLSYYSPNINITNYDLIISLLNNKEILYQLINNNINNTFLLYFIEKPLISNLYYISTDSDLEIIKSNSYSKDFFLQIVKNYSDNINNICILLKILCDNYVYPIKFNKLEIDSNFDDILFLSLFNIKLILNIENNKYYLNNNINNILPTKIKLLYFNLIKFFYLIIYNNDINDLLTIKYFQDSLQKNILKIFFTNLNNNCTSLQLLQKLIKDNNNDDIIIISKIKNIIKIYYLLNDVINKLSWSNLSNRLSYLSILMENNKYLFYKDKYNKILFPNNIDHRLKNIIINPFEMFKYLRKENDFYKWLKFLGIKCIDLYTIPISISSDDFINLGKILFNLINIKEQNIKDNIYAKFIQYCIKYPKLILDDTNRINLKIKDYFSYTSCNINLGILAKQLTIKNNTSYIELNLDEDIDNEIIKLQNKLQCVTKKYIKYKKKYINIINDLNNSNKLSNTS